MARNAIVSVVVSGQEKRVMERAAELAGESLSAFARRAVLDRTRRMAEDLEQREREEVGA